MANASGERRGEEMGQEDSSDGAGLGTHEQPSPRPLTRRGCSRPRRRAGWRRCEPGGCSSSHRWSRAAAPRAQRRPWRREGARQHKGFLPSRDTEPKKSAKTASLHKFCNRSFNVSFVTVIMSEAPCPALIAKSFGGRYTGDMNLRTERTALVCSESRNGDTIASASERNLAYYARLRIGDIDRRGEADHRPMANGLPCQGALLQLRLVQELCWS